MHVKMMAMTKRRFGIEYREMKWRRRRRGN
jgi:hypothetical protein